MKLKNGYSLTSQNDAYLVCFNGVPLEKTVILNAIGAYLWQLLSENDLSTAQLLDLLLKKFEISTVLALGEIDTFIKSMKENGIVE